jgi:hypothetical protein
MDSIDGINAVTGNQLTPEQRAVVAKLAARDRDVRAHEQAHMAAAGTMADGSIQYIYQLGPDGKLYAVGGKVDITVTPGATPEESLAKARQLRMAADAPSDPSGQDMSVAAQASEMEAKALQEISQEKQRGAASGHEGPFRGLDLMA